MLRIASIAALVIALAPSGSAAAQDCTCRSYSTEHGARVVSILESFEVGPLFSSDGTLLSSRAEFESELARGNQEKQGGDVLWCAGPYDSHCAPAAPSPEDSPRALRSSSSGALADVSLRWPRLSPGSSDLPPCEGGPRAGILARVERPPRA
jgi:hypothetical protein